MSGGRKWEWGFWFKLHLNQRLIMLPSCSHFLTFSKPKYGICTQPVCTCACVNTGVYLQNTPCRGVLLSSHHNTRVLRTVLEFTWSYADKDAVRSCIGQGRHAHWNWLNISNPGCEVEKYCQIEHFTMQKTTTNLQSLTFTRKDAGDFFFLTANRRELPSLYNILWLGCNFFSWPELTESCVGVNNMTLNLRH